MPNYEVVRPALDSFEENFVNEADRTLKEKHAYYLAKEINYAPGGWYQRWYEGVEYPEKGFPFPEGAAINNIIKGVTISLITSFACKEMILPLLGFFITPWKFKIKAANHFLEKFSITLDTIAHMANVPYYRKFERCIPITREIYAFLYQFLVLLGIHDNIANRLAKAFSMTIEYDDSYSYRIRDLFTMTSKEALLKNPRREIQKLMMIYHSRSWTGDEYMYSTHLDFKFKSFAKLLSLLLLHPKVKKAFITSLSGIDIEMMKLDKADEFFTLLKSDYNYCGHTDSQRRFIYEALFIGKGKPYPPQIQM